MRIRCIQHVPFEGPAYILSWAAAGHHEVSLTRIYEDTNLPAIGPADCLIIMGGPMSVNEEDKYPWLKIEKDYVLKAIQMGITVVGICLGAQIIASALGARVYKNNHREIGWFPVSLSSKALTHGFFRSFPERFNAFHWHGETFDLPGGSFHAAESEACGNQCFIYNDRVIGIQFHLESTMGSIYSLITYCEDDLSPDRYVQPREKLLNSGYAHDINSKMKLLMDNIAGSASTD
jgi:GMP synthase-like glutamine amidotransferase